MTPRVSVTDDHTVTLAPHLSAISPLLDACRNWAAYHRDAQDAFDRRAVDYQDYADRALAAHEAVEEMVAQLSPISAHEARKVADALWAAANSADRHRGESTGPAPMNVHPLLGKVL